MHVKQISFFHAIRLATEQNSGKKKERYKKRGETLPQDKDIKPDKADCFPKWQDFRLPSYPWYKLLRSCQSANLQADSGNVENFHERSDYCEIPASR